MLCEVPETHCKVHTFGLSRLASLASAKPRVTMVRRIYARDAISAIRRL